MGLGIPLQTSSIVADSDGGPPSLVRTLPERKIGRTMSMLGNRSPWPGEGKVDWGVCWRPGLVPVPGVGPVLGGGVAPPPVEGGAGADPCADRAAGRMSAKVRTLAESRTDRLCNRMRNLPSSDSTPLRLSGL